MNSPRCKINQEIFFCLESKKKKKPGRNKKKEDKTRSTTLFFQKKMSSKSKVSTKPRKPRFAPKLPRKVAKRPPTKINLAIEKRCLMHVSGHVGSDLVEVVRVLKQEFPDLLIQETDSFALKSKEVAEKLLQDFVDSSNHHVVFVGRLSTSTAKTHQPKLNCIFKAFLDTKIGEATESALIRDLQDICAHIHDFMDMNATKGAKFMDGWLNDHLNLRHREHIYEHLHRTYRDMGYKTMSLGEICALLRKVTKEG